MSFSRFMGELLDRFVTKTIQHGVAMSTTVPLHSKQDYVLTALLVLLALAVVGGVKWYVLDRPLQMERRMVQNVLNTSPDKFDHFLQKWNLTSSYEEGTFSERNAHLVKPGIYFSAPRIDEYSFMSEVGSTSLPLVRVDRTIVWEENGKKKVGTTTFWGGHR